MPADFEPFSIVNPPGQEGPLRAFGTFRGGDFTQQA